MRQIVCISTSNYNPIPTRKQNVMNRLSDAEIIYIDPPVSLLAPLKDQKTWPRLFAYKNQGEKVRENVTVYGAPPVLPFFNQHRWINRINQKRLARFLKKKIKEHGFENPYLWCYSPSSCDVVDLIPNRGVIYDCVDRHSAYQGMIDPAVVDRMEEDLAKKCAQVFCTAQGLYDTLIGYNPTTKLIPNGAAYELFSKAAEPEKEQTEALKNTNALDNTEALDNTNALDNTDALDNTQGADPVFGFVGMLQECIDYDCICAVAEAYPQGKVVMIGRSLPGVDLSQLKAHSNIELLGLIPQTELPEHIREFDVCLNVFREGRLSKDVSPLKFYEYLATGKPIVSTGEPLQVGDFADVVHIAHDQEAFVAACGEALLERDEKKKEQRMAYGRACSWEERVKEMEQRLTEQGVF